MPRIAMKDYNTSFFHIMVQGIRKEYVFREEEDIETYYRLIYKYISKYHVKIIAYCIMNNHAHLLVYVEKINELSEFMRAINTTYALYYNKKYKLNGYVFRNRYRAEPLYSQKYLINCINYIHNNPVVAKICDSMEKYKFSSYIEYKFKYGNVIKESIKKFPEINVLFIDNINDEIQTSENFIEYEEEKEFTEAESIIENFKKLNKVNNEDIIKNKEYLYEIAVKLNKECGLTHEEIANKFGVSRIKVTRVINKM